MAIPAVNACTVRDNLNLLLAEGIMQQVPHQRALTVALTEQGEQTLTALALGERHTSTFR